MSSYPIIYPKFYQGKWAHRYLDYALFPIGNGYAAVFAIPSLLINLLYYVGLVVDPLNDRYILLSIGSQDKDGYIIRIEIEPLLASLELVHDCFRPSIRSSEFVDNKIPQNSTPFECIPSPALNQVKCVFSSHLLSIYLAMTPSLFEESD
jgi:hypothetical protein